MKKYFSLLLISSFSWNALAAVSFYDFSPRAQSIEGISYPRNDLYQYRGTTDAQMNLDQALRALLGDPNVYVESLFFSTLKNRLMKKHFPPAIDLQSFLSRQIDALISANGGPLGEDKAAQETKKLVDGTFQYLDSRNGLLDRYVNYKSSSFVDWPQDVVFTTVISPVSGTYGDRILVIKENKKRSLDLNFWNKVHQDLWFHYTRDIGEFITFGYLNPEDLQGYQLRSGSSKSWHYINTAFYKAKSPGSRAVLVMSGKKSSGQTSSCMDWNNQDETLYHCEYRPGRVATRPPSLSREKVQIIGVIVLCSNGKCDAIPNEAQKYPVSSQNFSLSSPVSINGKTARFIRINP